MAHFHSNALIGASGADTGDDDAVATKSLRFNSGDSAYLTRTPSSAGNRKTWTLSFWVKLCGSSGHLVSAGNDAFQMEIRSDGQYLIQNSGCFNNTYSTAVFRDYSAWQHFVIEHDATNTYCKIYVNGSLQKTISASNANGAFNNNTAHNFNGRSTSLDSFTDFYLADVHFVDGTALTPTSFGAFNSNGVWQASVFSASHGTNGFHLKFGDSSSNAALGKDSSGNNNTFTVNNLSAAGQTSSSAAVLNLPLNSTPFADSSASSATVTNTGSVSTTFAASNSFNISTVASLNGSSQRLNTNNNNISFQGDWTVDGYFIIDNGSSAYNALFNSGYGSQTSNYMYIGFDNLNRPYVETSSSGSRTTASNAISKNVWYHIRVIQTGGTITLYINGTSYLTKTAQTTDLSSQGSNTIGSFLDNGNNANNFFGQLGPFRIINDALDAPPSGGAATTAGALSNTGTKTDVTAIDNLFDVPTNGDQSDTGAGGEVSGNYCLPNPLRANSNVGFSDGNLNLNSTAGGWYSCTSTIGISSGKFYWEATAENNSSGALNSLKIGIAPANSDVLGSNAVSVSNGYAYVQSNGNKQTNGTQTSYGSSASAGDVVMVAFDADNGKIWWGKNGTWFASGDPAAGSNAAFTSIASDTYIPVFSFDRGRWIANFGARSFAYTAPSGYKALCTTNLPTPTIADGSDYFDTTLYTGTGSQMSISGLSFSPDFIWIKRRDGAGSSSVNDIVRGISSELSTNEQSAESTAGKFVSFDSTGWTMKGGYGTINLNGQTFAGWSWDGGSSTVSNSNGTITSSVRANASAGVSIVGWAGTGVGSATVGHGLNAAPKIVIIKNRTNTSDWAFYHTLIDGSYDYLYLNQTSANADSGWNAPTNSVFSASNASASSTNVIAYCFTPVAGFSSMGSFENPSSSDGAFVHCGFRPAFILAKCAKNVSSSSGTGDWILKDSARSPFNDPSDGNTLVANVNNAEDGYYSAGQAAVDILSNGFKIRHPNSSPLGDPGRLYVYIAFAENPFQANGGLAR